MKRKHRRLRTEADLDITAFMNLMIVLVPILLINMIFAHTSVLELNFPTQNTDQAMENELVQLQVIISPDELLVADNKGGVIKQIASKDGHYDFETLGLVMKDLVAAVSVGRVDDKLVVDLDYHEESYEDGPVADIPIAMMPSYEKLTLLQMDGLISKEDLSKVLDMGKKVCKNIYEIQKKALKEKYKE